MGNTPGLRFQGKCLVNDEGYKYMCYEYDGFPELVRERLKSSTYNLCAACVKQEARHNGGNYCEWPAAADYLKVISKMEAELKRQEENGA